MLGDFKVAFNSQSRVFVADLSTGVVTSFDPNASGNTGLLADIQGLPDGSLLVTWTEVDGGSGLLKAGIFDLAGAALGTVVTVTEAGNNRYATATLLSDGNVALAWTDTASNDIETTILIRNHGPELTGAAGILETGTEDMVYTISTADLLAGYTDADGDSLVGGDTEYLYLTGTADLNGWGNYSANTFNGDSGANRLRGDRGHDRLDGGGGADTLIGVTGNDTYVVDNAGDVISDQDENFFSGGTDVVEASVSWTLGTDLEQLVLTGAAAIDGTGNGLGNVLTGNSARNVLSGGLGNDTYYIQNETDRVVELHHEGDDTIYSSVSYSLFGRAVETLILTGTGHLNATGNSLNNILTGTSGNNVLNGGTGGDLMTGGLSDDTYYVDNVYDNVAELHVRTQSTLR